MNRVYISECVAHKQVQRICRVATKLGLVFAAEDVLARTRFPFKLLVCVAIGLVADKQRLAHSVGTQLR